MRCLKIVGALLVLAIVAGCGTSASDLAKKDAQSMAYQLANTKMSGDQALDQLHAIENILTKNKLGFTDIGRSRSELSDKVTAAYMNDAKRTVNELRGTHADLSRAKALKSEIQRCLKLASNSYGSVGTSDDEIARIIGRNSLEEADRSGAKVTPAMMIAAGMKVPIITRTRTVIQRVPARPAVTRKPLAPAKKPVTRASRRR